MILDVQMNTIGVILPWFKFRPQPNIHVSPIILNPIPGGEVNLPLPRDNAENSKNMQAEGLLFFDF